MTMAETTRIARSVAELRACVSAWRRAGETVGVVPTMGALHRGHISLVEAARAACRRTIATIFVNPKQFGPREDFDKYPRTLDADCNQLQAAGCDVVFVPDEGEIYPEPQGYSVEPPDIQHILDGAIRPGHFRGVATVVLKLFNMVQPHAAIFGKKDYQQCIVLRNMVRQLALPIEIILAETVRAADGLALSSRNGYLSVAERTEAPALHRVLLKARDELSAGKRDFQRIELEGMASLAGRGWKPDYLAIRRQADLLPPEPDDRALVVLGAAKLGNTRLIDNVEVVV